MAPALSNSPAGITIPKNHARRWVGEEGGKAGPILAPQ
jgi:hypothetical protein